MADLGQKKVDLSAFFYTLNPRGGERVAIETENRNLKLEYSLIYRTIASRFTPLLNFPPFLCPISMGVILQLRE